MKDSNTRKKIIIIAATLFLIIAVAEGFLCVHIFKPKNQDVAKDKRLITMLDQYVDMVEKGADKKVLKIFHFEVWDGMDEDILCHAMDMENANVKNLTYTIVGARENTDESMIVAVDFKYTLDNQELAVRKDIPVTKGKKDYTMEWFHIAELDNSYDAVRAILNDIVDAIQYHKSDMYLQHCAYTEETKEEWEKQIEYQLAHIKGISVTTGGRDILGPVESYLRLHVDTFFYEYYIDYEMTVSYGEGEHEDVIVKGTSKLIFQCDNDEYKLTDMPDWMIDPTDTGR